LADDLRRFIAGQSVSVYSEPLIDQVARFVGGTKGRALPPQRR